MKSRMTSGFALGECKAMCELRSIQMRGICCASSKYLTHSNTLTSGFEVYLGLRVNNF